MTHLECQPLLLDLVYGELDAARAAEVQAHAAGCDQCAPELREISSARAVLSPLMARLDEPSAAIDDTLLKAARDEAARLGAAAEAAQPRQAAAAGPRIVEVSARIGMPEAAAPFDTRAPVVARAQAEPPRRRWALRAVIGGSVAAAAALVLVAIKPSPNLPQGESRVEVREIVIRAPSAGQPVSGGVAAPAVNAPVASAPAAAAPSARTLAKDAAGHAQAAPEESKQLARREEAGKSEEAAKKKGAGPADSLALDQPARAALAEDDKAVAKAAEPAPPPPAAPPAMASPASAASPKTTAPAPAKEKEAPPAEREAASQEAQADSADGAREAQLQLKPGVVASGAQRPSRSHKVASAPPTQPLSALGSAGAGSSNNSNSYGQVAQNYSAGALGNPRGQSGNEVVNIAAQLEARARTMRMNGSYSEAATLYKQAASLHQRAAENGLPPQPASNQAPIEAGGSPGRDAASQVAGPAKSLASDSAGDGAALAAAWDLAHAIECLAADAQIDQAKSVYEDLLTSFPSASGPQNAALRALRSSLPPSQRNAAPLPESAH